MFRKYYKEANDEIKGNRMQIDKLFALAEEKPKKRFVFPFRYATAFAAVLVLVVAFYSYPELSNLINPNSNELETVDLKEYKYPELENAVISDKSKRSSDEDQVKDKIPNSDKTEPADAKTVKNAKVEESAKADTKDALPKASGAIENKAVQKNQIEVAQNADKADGYVEAEAAVMPSMESPQNDALSENKKQKEREYNEEEINTFSMQAIMGGSGGNEPILDKAPTSLYNRVDYGDGRYALTACFEENEEIEKIINESDKTVAYGTEAVAQTTGEVTTLYILDNGMYYKIEAHGLSKQEISELIHSTLN